MSRLFVVSGPSGVGKSSLCHALLADMPNLNLSISCTTRRPRPGEEDGREYHFLTVENFKAQRDQHAFLEWAEVHGNFYGTRQSDVETVLASGRDVLLEIDWQGAAQVAAKMPETVRIFILPPSIESLKERLTARGQDEDTVVQQRIAAAEAEIAHAGEAHHSIVNQQFTVALSELKALFAS